MGRTGKEHQNQKRYNEETPDKTKWAGEGKGRANPTSKGHLTCTGVPPKTRSRLTSSTAGWEGVAN